MPNSIACANSSSSGPAADSSEESVATGEIHASTLLLERRTALAISAVWANSLPPAKRVGSLRRRLGRASSGDNPPLGDRVVTFDLDGTLVDLRAAYIGAHQQAAREVLEVELSEAHVLELMSTGKPIREHMSLLDDDAADHLVTAFVECYRLEREGFARPFPGVIGLLGRLQGAALGVAVVTSKLREDALAELRATGLEVYVDVVIAFEDTAEHKPAAAPHLEALRLLRARTGIGVGDLPSDVASARAAGLAAFGVSWGYGVRDALLEAGAERVCDSAGELERELWLRLR